MGKLFKIANYIQVRFKLGGQLSVKYSVNFTDQVVHMLINVYP